MSGFAVQILIHELGHVFAVKRRGLKADLPVFLPGFGAYVRWQGFDISVDARAEIALAGPFFGLLAAAGCMGLYAYTQRPVFAALAHAGAWLNLINLIPVWMLGRWASSPCAEPVATSAVAGGLRDLLCADAAGCVSAGRGGDDLPAVYPGHAAGAEHTDDGLLCRAAVCAGSVAAGDSYAAGQWLLGNF